MQIISFSLYGSNPIYLTGALVNAQTVQRYYPGWICRFYVGASVPYDLREQLIASRAEVVFVSAPERPSATTWRFQPIFEDTTMLLIRDCDSRFSSRELVAVNDWLSGNYDFHIMRDHPEHRVPILTGMFGLRGAGINEVAQLLPRNSHDDTWGIDQLLLTRHVYARIKNKACIHDSYFCYEWHSRNFPTQRSNYEFIGEVIDADNQANAAQRKIVEKAETSFLYRLRLKSASLKDKIMQKGYWSPI